MFKIKLEENAGAAYLEALDALNKILDGEGDYKNYRAYVLNLHGALELFFKKKLFDHNEFMLFSFSDYRKLIEKYMKAFKANQSIFEYIEASNSNMPNTVTFDDAIERLAYLYKDSEFTFEYLSKLKSLNILRNNITHFELNIKDDQFVLLNELFIACTEYYSEYLEWGYIAPIDETRIRDKNFTIRKAIVADDFNRKLLRILDDNSDSLVDDLLDFPFFAKALIDAGDFEEHEKDKIIRRLQIFENAGFFGYGSAGGEHWDVGWFYLNDTCHELLKEYNM